MLTKEEIVKKLGKNKAEIKSFGVKKLTLFGSYARNTATKKSDIDFLVEYEKGRGLVDDALGLLEFLRQLFKREIDLVKPALIRKELKESILRGRKIETI